VVGVAVVVLVVAGELEPPHPASASVASAVASTAARRRVEG